MDVWAAARAGTVSGFEREVKTTVLVMCITFGVFYRKTAEYIAKHSALTIPRLCFLTA
jgi:hypothetical protein